MGLCMQAELCWAWTAQPVQPKSGAVDGLSLVVGPHPSVCRVLGRSRLQRPCSPGRLNCRGWAATSRLQRLTAGRRTGRCPRLQSQVREDLLDRRLLKNRRNDLQLTAAVRAVLQVDLEHALEQLRSA